MADKTTPIPAPSPTPSPADSQNPIAGPFIIEISSGRRWELAIMPNHGAPSLMIARGVSPPNMQPLGRWNRLERVFLPVGKMNELRDVLDMLQVAYAMAEREAAAREAERQRATRDLTGGTKPRSARWRR